MVVVVVVVVVIFSIAICVVRLWLALMEFLAVLLLAVFVVVLRMMLYGNRSWNISASSGRMFGRTRDILLDGHTCQDGDNDVTAKVSAC